jgi:hypothetical protein
MCGLKWAEAFVDVTMYYLLTYIDVTYLHRCYYNLLTCYQVVLSYLPTTPESTLVIPGTRFRVF